MANLTHITFVSHNITSTITNSWAIASQVSFFNSSHITSTSYKIINIWNVTLNIKNGYLDNWGNQNMLQYIGHILNHQWVDFCKYMYHWHRMSYRQIQWDYNYSLEIKVTKNASSISWNCYLCKLHLIVWNIPYHKCHTCHQHIPFCKCTFHCH